MMDNKTFEEQIADLAERSRQADKKQFLEAQTVLTVILPFIIALEYDIFDFEEVVAEFPADFDKKKGKKIDFALRRDGETAIYIEAKAAKKKLNDADREQLYRYFTAENKKEVKKIAILTNGIEAWFYAGTDEGKLMDEKPFFNFNFQKNNSDHVKILKKFRKNNFDANETIDFANSLKHSKKVNEYLEDEESDNDKKINTEGADKTKVNHEKGNLKNPNLPKCSKFENGKKAKWIKRKPRWSTYLFWREKIRNFEEIQEYDNLHYISYCRIGKDGKPKTFASIGTIAKTLHIGLGVNKTELNLNDRDKNNDDFCEDHEDSNWLGYGNTTIKPDDNADQKHIDYVSRLIDQAYDIWKKNNGFA